MSERKFIEVNKDTKEINVNFRNIPKKFLYGILIGLVLWAGLAVLNYIDFGISKTYLIECVNGSTELFEIGKQSYCGETLDMNTYNYYVESIKNG